MIIAAKILSTLIFIAGTGLYAHSFGDGMSYQELSRTRNEREVQMWASVALIIVAAMGWAILVS